MTVDTVSQIPGTGRDGDEDGQRVRTDPLIGDVRARLSKLGWLALCLGLVLLVGLPLGQILYQLLKDPAGAVSDVRAIPDFGETLRLTIYLGLGSAVIAVVVGVALATWVNRLGGKVAGVARAIPLLPLLLPPQVTVVGWIFLLSPVSGYANGFLRKFPPFDTLTSGPIDIYTPLWMTIIQGLFLVPFVFFFALDALRSLGSSLEAAAVVSGATRARAFFTVTLPLLRPAIVYSFALVVVLGAGQFTVPLLLGRQKGLDVLTTEVFRQSGTYPVPYALTSAIASPLILLGIVIVLFQRRMVGESRRYVVGRDDTRPGPAGWWSLFPVGLYACVVLLPLLAVTHIAMSPSWSDKLTFSNYSFANFRAVLDDGRLGPALVRSLEISAITAVVVVALTFMVAMALAFGGGPGRVGNRIMDLAVNVPLGIPATVLGLGVLLTYSREPFRWYGTEAIMLVVYFTIMLPFATRLQLAALLTQGVSYRDASAVSGASGLRTTLRVVAPLARTGIVSAIIFTFILSLYEFSASLMVSSAQNEVVGKLFFDYYDQGQYTRLAALSLIMVVLAVGCVAVIMFVGAERRHDKTLAARARRAGALLGRRPNHSDGRQSDRSHLLDTSKETTSWQ